jgi:type I restriction enzyme S subunit
MRKYDSYKDSGVEWIGEIPSYWHFYNLKFILREGVKDGPHETPVWCEDGIPFLSIDGIINGEISFDKCRYIDEEQFEQFSKKLIIEKDDIFIGKAASIGKIARVKTDRKFTVWSPIAVVKVKKEYNPIFVEYYLRSDVVQHQIELLSTSNTQKNIAMGDIPKMKFIAPSFEEQTAIANFLDQKTTQIDDLIAKKERLIQLLEEERTAIINQSVTKGLDSNVPMKDSGVEWLGEIPAHWDCFQLKRLISYGRKITYGIVQPGNFDPNGRFMVRGQDYSKGWADQETIFKVSPDIEEPYARARLVAGDILYTIVGAGVGNIAIVPDWLDGANITQTTARISVDPIKIFPKFCFYFLKSTIAKAYLDIYVKGAAQPGINLSDLKLFYFTVPPLNEQILIANFIDQKSSKIDELSIKMSKEIELLKEYKTALISEVVTGKVDVSTNSTQVLEMKN